MIPRAELEIRDLYGDLLEGDDGREMLRVIRVLDAGLGMERAPASRAPRRLPQPPEVIPPRSPWGRRLLLGIASVVAIVATVLASFAASGILDLGKYTNSVPPPPNHPLSAFRKAGPFLSL